MRQWVDAGDVVASGSLSFDALSLLIKGIEQ
jgi:hypothetical protein